MSRRKRKRLQRQRERQIAGRGEATVSAPINGAWATAAPDVAPEAVSADVTLLQRSFAEGWPTDPNIVGKVFAGLLGGILQHRSPGTMTTAAWLLLAGDKHFAQRRADADKAKPPAVSVVYDDDFFGTRGAIASQDQHDPEYANFLRLKALAEDGDPTAAAKLAAMLKVPTTPEAPPNEIESPEYVEFALAQVAQGISKR